MSGCQDMPMRVTGGVYVPVRDLDTVEIAVRIEGVPQPDGEPLILLYGIGRSEAATLAQPIATHIAEQVVWALSGKDET